MRYEILTDEGPMHPRKEEGTSFGTILYTSSRYELGDERVSGEEIDEKLKDPSVIALPVFAYIHGSVALNTTGFNDRFDSGQSGCIFVSKEDIRRIWKIKRITAAQRASVEEMLRNEIKIYSQYLAGEVYGYRIFDDQNEEIEACWGFYGMETAKQEAEEAMKQRAEYVPPSPQALAALEAGIESAKRNPPILSKQDFTQFIND